MVVSVIFNMSILKSPITNDGFFVLDSLCSIVCIYSLKKSRLEYSGGRYITPINVFSKLEHIGWLARMSVSGCRGRRFEPRQQYVVSLSKTLYPHCFSRLSCEMSTR